MTLKFAALAMPVFALAIGFAGASSAMDTMPMMEGMKVDPMAMECMTMAHNEKDMAKMEAMATDCKAKYPDAAAIECVGMASMETDATKMGTMMADCQKMYPEAMGDAMAGGAMAPAQ
jgi:hypothetical protein